MALIFYIRTVITTTEPGIGDHKFQQYKHAYVHSSSHLKSDIFSSVYFLLAHHQKCVLFTSVHI